MKKGGYKNPVPAVDAIIQMDTQILLVKRKNQPFRGYMAIPGGFVNEGETVEDAQKCEVREETSLDIELVDILGVYSDPKRDPRGHIMSTVFIAYVPVNRNKSVEALGPDDASELEWIDLEAIPNEKFAFDHKRILMDYIKWKESGETFWSSKATKSSKS